MGYLSIYKGWEIICRPSSDPQWPHSIFTLRFVETGLNMMTEA